MDWLPEFADDDIQTLLDALEAWEVKDNGAELYGEMIEALIDGTNPRAADKIADARRREKQQAERAKVLRKERSVLLRAKLLMLRDRRRIDQARSASLPTVDAVARSDGTSTS